MDTHKKLNFNITRLFFVFLLDSLRREESWLLCEHQLHGLSNVRSAANNLIKLGCIPFFATLSRAAGAQPRGKQTGAAAARALAESGQVGGGKRAGGHVGGGGSLRVLPSLVRDQSLAPQSAGPEHEAAQHAEVLEVCAQSCGKQSEAELAPWV